jgi:hypothetical protein
MNMGQFLEVQEITGPFEEKTTPRILNKNFVTNIEDDTRHNQTYIHYKAGEKLEEIKVRDDFQKIRSWLLEE